MYAQRYIQPYAYGFPAMPAARPTGTSAVNQTRGTVSTQQLPPQYQPSALQQYGPNVASSALRQAMSPSSPNITWNGPRAGSIDWNTGRVTNGTNMGDDYSLMNSPNAQYDPSTGTWTTAPNSGVPVGTQPADTGAAGTPSTQGGLLSDASTPETTTAAGDTSGVATGTTAGTGTGTAAGTTAGTDAAATGTTAGTDAAATGAAAGTDAAATDAGLLATTADTGATAADAGLLGTGAAAGGEAAAAAGAAEGTAATVGATNFWNPLGWAALAGLAAYQLGLFD